MKSTRHLVRWCINERDKIWHFDSLLCAYVYKRCAICNYLCSVTLVDFIQNAMFQGKKDIVEHNSNWSSDAAYISWKSYPSNQGWSHIWGALFCRTESWNSSKNACTRWIRQLICGTDKAFLQLMFQIFHSDLYLDIELNTPTNMGEISHANIW